MNENTDASIKDLMKDVSTEALIEELRTRALTTENVTSLQSLKPVDKTEKVVVAPEVSVPMKTKSSAERFAKAVVRKNAHGKLPAGSKINNLAIDGSKSGGFYDHGPDKIELSALENGVVNLQLGILYQNQDRFPDLVSTHIVTVTPSKMDSGNMVLTIRFFQDPKQIGGRGLCAPAHVSTELPNGTMSEFLGEIQKTPDLLEDFYQKTFVGIDSSGESPGMRRVKADGFYLVAGAKLEEASKVGSYDKDGTRRFFESLQKFQYQSGPYGSEDAFQPR